MLFQNEVVITVEKLSRILPNFILLSHTEQRSEHNEACNRCIMLGVQNMIQDDNNKGTQS